MYPTDGQDCRCRFDWWSFLSLERLPDVGAAVSDHGLGFSFHYQPGDIYREPASRYVQGYVSLGMDVHFSFGQCCLHGNKNSGRISRLGLSVVAGPG
jgi:hypothetical protein